MHLVVVEISSDADRKRLEYVVGKWSGRLRIEKLCQGVLLVDGEPESTAEFARELYSRFPEDSVRLYKLVEPEFKLEPEVREFSIRVPLGDSEVWGAIDLLMARMRGLLSYRIGCTREYIVRSRYGVVKTRFTVSRGTVRVEVEGYGEAPDKVLARIQRELELLGGIVE